MSRGDEDRGAELDAALSSLLPALEHLSFPIYILDRQGRITWLNDSARNLVGDIIGRDFTAVVAPEHTVLAREEFSRKLLGADVTDFAVNVLRRDGTRVPVEISSVPIKDRGMVVGVFGVARAAPVEGAREPAPPGVELTARQHEVLRLLAEGCSTDDIARELGISPETVRNHVREILRRLGVHSRIEALAKARRYGLL